MSSSLVGKFVFHWGGEFCHWGEVIEAVNQDTVLVKFDKIPEAPNARTVAFDVSEFATVMDTDGSFACTWEFFNSRKELQTHLDWIFALEEPSTVLKVVKLKP